MNLPTRRLASAAAQSGAASLIVVMVLFFIIAMTAAYTNRNLIFEQRTSLNHLRATTAFEAADAGAEWAIARLNAGRMDASCTVDAAAGANTSFRERYLTIGIDPVNGTSTLVPKLPANAGSVNPVCVFDGRDVNSANWGWQCKCPLADEAAGSATGRPSQPVPADKPAPAFMIRLGTVAGGRTDVFSLYSYGCTHVSDAADPRSCLDHPDKVISGDAVARVQIAVALRYALTRLPSAALTVDGGLPNLPVPNLTLTNTDVASNGVTLHVGNPLQALPVPGITSQSFAGTNPVATQRVELADAVNNPLQPPLATVAGEPDFTVEDRRFAAFFGMRPSTYQNQPGLPVLDCTGGCNSAAVQNMMDLNPGRPIWIRATRPVAQPADILTINAPLGTAAVPALLIVEGDVVFSPGVAYTGLLYGIKSNPVPVGTPWVWPGTWTWTGAAGATVRGAAVAQGDLIVNGAGLAITYDADVLKRLRLNYGTFVRVPGSWRDFL